MVVRKRRNALADHPVPMTRFDLSEWPDAPVVAFEVWRREFLTYWRKERHPRGIFGLLATIEAGRRLVRTGEICDVDNLARSKADRAWGEPS